MSVQLSTSLGSLTVTRFADGSVHVSYDPQAPDFVLDEAAAAELKNYLMETSATLQATKDAVALATLEAADLALVQAAEATTEVMP